MLKANNNRQANTNSVYFKRLIICVLMLKKCIKPFLLSLRFQSGLRSSYCFSILAVPFQFLKTEIDKISISLFLKIIFSSMCWIDNPENHGCFSDGWIYDIAVNNTNLPKCLKNVSHLWKKGLLLVTGGQVSMPSHYMVS